MGTGFKKGPVLGDNLVRLEQGHLDDTLRKGDKKTGSLSCLPFPSPAGVQNSTVLNNMEQPLSLAGDRDTGLAGAVLGALYGSLCVSVT